MERAHVFWFFQLKFCETNRPSRCLKQRKPLVRLTFRGLSMHANAIRSQDAFPRNCALSMAAGLIRMMIYRNEKAGEINLRKAVVLRRFIAETHTTVILRVWPERMKLGLAIWFVMPGLVPGIHVWTALTQKDVDAGTKPGHDGSRALVQRLEGCAASACGSSFEARREERRTPPATTA
jgi:hypothetical protein